MALPVAALWAGAAAATVVVAGAGTYWVYSNLPSATLVPAATEATEGPARFAPPAAPVASASPAVAALPTAPPPSAPASIKPAFDVVSVEPAGDTVVAGRAAPNAKVELRDGSRVLGEATADAGGQFVIVPEALAPGNHELILVTGAGETAQSSKTVALSVAAPPSKTASAAPAAGAAVGSPAGTAGPPASIAVKSVEVRPSGRFVAKGAAPPNAIVRLYLSGAFVGDARTKDDGLWSLTIETGMTPGAYIVRADEIRPADGTVVARAEAPFDYPHTTPDAPAETAAVASPADVVLTSVQTAHVAAGDTLWGLSQTFYGDGSRYQLIFAANNAQIRDPNRIYPGQMFVVPKPNPQP